MTFHIEQVGGTRARPRRSGPIDELELCEHDHLRPVERRAPGAQGDAPVGRAVDRSAAMGR
jgi:hypothetical protein